MDDVDESRVEVLEREHAQFFENWHAERRKREALEAARAEDSELLDFLADVNQTVANVQLPTHIVLSNVQDMRDAIRETKRAWEVGELSPNARAQRREGRASAAAPG